jgi:hypothetical protein
MEVAGLGGRGLVNLDELHDVVGTPSRARHRYMHHTNPQTTTMPLRIVLKSILVIHSKRQVLPVTNLPSRETFFQCHLEALCVWWKPAVPPRYIKHRNLYLCIFIQVCFHESHDYLLICSVNKARFVMGSWFHTRCTSPL